MNSYHRMLEKIGIINHVRCVGRFLYMVFEYFPDTLIGFSSHE